MIFHNICGIDLGTDTIKIRDKHNKKFMDCKNMIAVRNQNQIIAIGDEAFEMYEKNPVNVEMCIRDSTCPV